MALPSRQGIGRHNIAVSTYRNSEPVNPSIARTLVPHQLPPGELPPLQPDVRLRLDVDETTPLEVDGALIPLMIAPPSPATLDPVLALTTEIEEVTGSCVVDGYEGGASVVLEGAVEEISVGAWANIDELEISFCKAAYVVDSVYEVVGNPFVLVKKKGAPE